MLRGFATVSYWADDLEAAKGWYSELLGIEPYFERPGYYEFRLGDYPPRAGSDRQPLRACLFDERRPGRRRLVVARRRGGGGPGDRLLSMGAKEHQPITERGTEGFITASVVDPFGNVVGIMYNPHYLEVLGSTGKA